MLTLLARPDLQRRFVHGSDYPLTAISMAHRTSALVAAGLAGDYRAGVEQAAKAIDSGAARDRLRALVEFTNRPG